MSDTPPTNDDGASTSSSWLRALGPGILFAGAAVGVSHLVQSTRAGATYGFALVLVVLAANALKYPGFRFGPEYAAITGTSLLEGYRRQGRAALVIYAAATALTMFAVQAAVTVVTAGLAIHLFGIPASALAVSIGLTLFSVVLLAAGRYRLLEGVGKIVVAALTVATLLATVLALPRAASASVAWLPSAAMFTDVATLGFIAALAGWMPSALDVAVWQSLWTLERGDAERAVGRPRPGRGVALLDFHVGYIGTIVLALCFVALGAIVMGGREIAPSAAGFAAQLVDLYGETLGAWSRPLIGACALLVMLSTTLTVVDGFPRAISVLALRFRDAEPPRLASADEAQGAEASMTERARGRRVYWVALAILGGGAMTLLGAFGYAMKTMVDVATTASFVTSPILALLNHRAMHGDEIPAAARPSDALRRFSIFSIAAQAAFALG